MSASVYIQPELMVKWAEPPQQWAHVACKKAIP